MEALKLRQIGDLYFLVPIMGPGKVLLETNATGAQIFEWRELGRTRQEIIDLLRSRFPSAPANIAADVDDFMSSIFADKPPTRSENCSAFHSRIRQIGATRHLPIDGTIELTFGCNLKCNHCYCAPESDRDVMSTEDCLRVMDEIAAAGCVWLLLTGGEVLTREDFPRLYEHAQRLGLLVTVFTNGLLINEAIAKLFTQFPPYWLEISIYGASNATYAALTGAKRGYDKLLRSLNILETRNISYSLKTCICRENVRDLEAIKALALARGVDFRFDAELHERLDGRHVSEDTNLSAEEVVALEFSDDSDSRANNWRQRQSTFPEQYFYCNGGATAFSIDPTGLLSLCGRYKLGGISVRDLPFAAAWQKILEQRATPCPQNLPCKSCEFTQYCKACPVVGQLSNSTLRAVFCDVARHRSQLVEQICSKPKKSELTFNLQRC